MSEQAIDTLTALASRVREAGDAATASEVLPQAMAIAQDTTLAPSRQLGAALEDLASALIPLCPGQDVLTLFGHADRLLQVADDTRIDDMLVLWHNLSQLYHRYGAEEPRDALITHIAQVAENWDGPLQDMGAQTLLLQASIHQRAGRVAPMQACLRQVHRVRNGDDQSAANRASWLSLYADMLSSTGCHAEADLVLAQAIEFAHTQGDGQGEAILLTRRAAGAMARGDFQAAAAAMDRALPLVEAPELAGTHLASTVWGNMAIAVLQQHTAARYGEARTLCSKAIKLLRNLGQGEGSELAYTLYYRGQLAERLGDRADAVGDYRAAAAVPGIQPGDAADWLTLAGDTLFDDGAFDSASDCYLSAVRRRVSLPAAQAAAGTESPG